LHFEVCEERNLLAIFSVTNLNDGVVTDQGDQPGTLRQAIFDANEAAGPDTIEFASTLSGTIALSGSAGEIAISDTLIINGLGANVLTIDAGGNSRIFNIENASANPTIELKGLTLTGGTVSGPGGAIRTTEDLTVRDSVVTGNSASGRGGGIYVANGILNVIDTTISGNTSAFDGGGIAALASNL
jgi:predicted outer membrane repeat protein